MPKKLFLVFLLLCLVLNQGCQNKRELNDLGIVLGMALDLGEKDRVKLTVQAAKPGQMKTGEEGGGAGKGSTLLLSGEGKTLFDAIRNLDTMSSKKLFFSHNQVVIIGENLAKKGLQQVVDFLERDAELRAEVPLLVARGEAGKILELSGNFEKVEAMGINETLQAAEFSGRVRKIPMYEVLRNQFKENQSSVVPRIEVVTTAGLEQPKIPGLAVLKNGQLAGWLNDTESRGYLWAQGKVKSGIIVIPAGQKTLIGLEIKEVKSKVDSKIVDGRPAFNIKVKVTSTIGEVTGPQKITPPGIVEKIEKDQSKAIAAEVESSIKKAKKMKADILGFGEEVHRNHPKEWKNLKSSWDRILTELKVTISVHSDVEDFGDKTDPTFSHKGGR